VAAPPSRVAGSARLKLLLGEVPLGAVAFPWLTLGADVSDPREGTARTDPPI
jgi:hypothetical protein